MRRRARRWRCASRADRQIMAGKAGQRMNGEKRRRHGRSIRRRLLVPICLLLTVQVAVLIGGVYFSGLLERMDENAYAVLDQRVQSRAGYLEDDMVRRWSNLSLTQEVLGELYEGLVQDGSVTPGELASDPAQYNAFLKSSMGSPENCWLIERRAFSIIRYDLVYK